MTTPAPLEKTIPGVYSYRHIFDDIDGVIRNFAPLAPKRFWNEAVQEFTRSAVTDMNTANEQEARGYMSAVARLAIWSVNVASLPLDRTIVLGGRNIDSYMRSADLQMSRVSLHDHRLRLHRVSAELVEFDPRRRDAGKRVRSDPFSPYADKDLIRFRSQGATRSTPRRRHNWMTLLALGAGCGLNTSEIVYLRVDDIELGPGSVRVTVDGKRPRTVVCLAEWEDDIRQLIDSPLVERFLFAKEDRPTYPHAYVTRFLSTAANDNAGFQVERLRSTWIVRHINAGTPVFALMHALGVKSLSTIERLEAHVRVPHDGDLTTAFRLAGR